MHFYKFNIGDYAAETKHLSLMEDLAYRRMLDVSYTTELPLPLDVKKIARFIVMREHIEEIEQVLEDFYTKTENGWTQKRVIKELELCNKIADISRENGKKGGRPKNPPSLDNNPVGSENKPDLNPGITQPVYTLHNTHYPLHITHNQIPITQNLLYSPWPGKPGKKVLDYSLWPGVPTESILQEWIAHKKKLKAPVNQRVINAMGKQLSLAANGNIPVDDCLTAVIDSGWKGFKYEWLKSQATSLTSGNEFSVITQQNMQTGMEWANE